MVINHKIFTFNIAMALLVLSSSHTLAFDPDDALKEQKTQKEAQKVKEEKAHYERYRNKAPVNINDDGTVAIGDLQWMRCSLGQQWDGKTCTGEASAHSWDEANDLPQLMNDQGGFAGYTDWRLPTYEELVLLRQCSSGRATGTITLPSGKKTFKYCERDDDWSGGQHKIDARAFPNTPQELFWSSETWYYDGEPTNFGLSVRFRAGYDDEGRPKYIEGRVRLVRDRK